MTFAAVLDRVRFPMRRWEVLAVADDYGVDIGTRTKLEQIPDREYASPDEVMIAMANTPAHLALRAQL